MSNLVPFDECRVDDLRAWWQIIGERLADKAQSVLVVYSDGETVVAHEYRVSIVDLTYMVAVLGDEAAERRQGQS